MKISAIFCAVGLVLSGFASPRLAAQSNAPVAEPLSFVVAGDMRDFTNSPVKGKRYFDGACEAMKKVGAGAFLISPGDIDPPRSVRATIDRCLGTNFLWYPVIGNHELAHSTDMNWLRHWGENIPHLVRRGPAGSESTTYSFDFGSSHFVVLNEYFNGKSDAKGNGDVCDAALAWLEKDLAANKQPFIWVIGHKPIQSQPDMDTQRLRHPKDSLSADPKHRERFIGLLNRYHIRAYICGHTHDASAVKVTGIWQIDTGHARGAGDTGAPSTFLKVRTEGQKAWADLYRADANGVEYKLRLSQELE